MEIKLANAAVFGMGKIGLPVAIQIAQSKQHNVIGVDVDETLIKELNFGQVTRVIEPRIVERLAEVTTEGSLMFSTPGKIQSHVTYVLIAVPVKLNEDDSADFSILDNVVQEIVVNFPNVELCIVETTLPIGSTSERVLDVFRKNDIKAHVVFSPERVSSGTIQKDLARYPKVIGCHSQVGALIAEEFYLSFLGLEAEFNNPKEGIIKFDSLEEAEAVKLLETTYRDVNIALANEFATIMDFFGCDFQKVADAANSQPLSHIHRPGLNVGGHCIPVYPKFLMNSVPFELRIVKESRTKNQKQPASVIQKIIKKFGRDVFLGGVLIIGLGYRDWVKESYRSGAIEVQKEVIREFGEKIEVRLIDPIYSADEINQAGLDSPGSDFNPKVVIVNSASFTEVTPDIFAFLEGADVIVLGRGPDKKFERWFEKVLLP